MNYSKAFFASLLMLVFAPGSLAALVEAGYSPPGGVTAVGSGVSPSHAGGKTWNLSGFDNTAYDELYYSVKNLSIYENQEQPMTYNSSLSDLAGGSAVWSNTVSFYNAQSQQYEVLNGTFTLTVTDAFNNSLALTDATSLGLDANLGGLLNVTGEFNANWLFELEGTPALEWYDAADNHPAHSLNTSVGSSFYYSPPSAVPLPAAAWLFGSALVGLVGLARRKNI
jgi:hypothetical protein